MQNVLVMYISQCIYGKGIKIAAKIMTDSVKPKII